jgi:MFS transporter, YNFM family, putative membrane transport protein
MHMDRRRLAVAAAGVCSFLDLYPTQSLLPVLAAEFQAGKAAVGLTVSATTLAVALVAPLAGHLADVLGRKRVMVAGAVLMAVPTLLAALSGSIGELVLWRFLQGLFLPAVFAVCAAYVAEECSPAEAADLTGIQVAGMVAGGFCGRFIAAIVGEAVGWRSAFPVLAALNLVCAAAIALWLPGDSKARSRRPGGGVAGALAALRYHLGNGRLLATCAVGFAILFSMVAAFTYVNFKLAAPPFSLGLSALGMVFVVFLFGVPVAPATGPLLRRFGRVPVMAAAVLLNCLGLALTLSGNLATVLAGLALFASGTFIAQPLAIGFAGLAAKDAKALAVGLYVCCYYIGGSLGGIIPAFLWDDFGWSGCALLIGAVNCLSLAIAWRAWRGQDRPKIGADGCPPAPGK